MRALTTEELAEAWSLQRAGVEHQNAGRLEPAKRALTDGLRLTEWARGDTGSGADRETTRVAARLLISLSYAECHLVGAESALSLLDDATTLAAPEDIGVLTHQRGVVLWLDQRFTEALAALSEAEPQLREHGPVWLLGHLMLNRAGVLGDLGRHRAARAGLGDCVRLAVEKDLPTLRAKATHSLAIIEHHLGNIPSALRLLAEATLLYTDHGPALLPNVWATRARVLLDAGLVKEAAEMARTAHAAAPSPRAGVTTAGHLATIALRSENWAEAVEHAQAGQRIADEVDDEVSATWLERLWREAVVHRGDVTDAFADETLRLLERQRELVPHRGFSDPARVLAARALIAVGRLDEAEEHLGTGRLADGPSMISVRMSRELARSEIAERRGAAADARRHIRTGLSMLHRHRSRLGSVELQAGVAVLGRRLAERGLGLAFDSGRASTVFAWAERVRAQAFRLPTVIPPVDGDDADLLAEVRRLRHGLSVAETAGRADPERLAECRRLERVLRERSWQVSRTGDSAPLATAADVHRRLEGRALVSYLRHGGDLHALVLVGGRTVPVPLGTAADVDETARRLRADLSAITGRRLPERMTATVRTSIARLTDRLAERLIAPIAARIGDADLVVVPTGSLMTLPWGMLPPLRGRPVTVAPSASMWSAARDRDTTPTGRVVIAAGPDLVHAEHEMDAIASLHAAPTVLRGAEAEHRTVLTALAGADAAHLAAHGHHEPDNVLFSRLDFADGPLMAYDLVRLSAPPRRVTLSACEVGESAVAAGDETLGFTSALLHAGTSVVVSSGVKVEHGTAVDVMTAYHRALTTGAAPARALADAAADHPTSPFVCYGAG